MKHQSHPDKDKGHGRPFTNSYSVFDGYRAFSEQHPRLSGYGGSLMDHKRQDHIPILMRLKQAPQHIISYVPNKRRKSLEVRHFRFLDVWCYGVVNLKRRFDIYKNNYFFQPCLSDGAIAQVTALSISRIP